MKEICYQITIELKLFQTVAGNFSTAMNDRTFAAEFGFKFAREDEYYSYLNILIHVMESREKIMSKDESQI